MPSKEKTEGAKGEGANTGGGCPPLPALAYVSLLLPWPYDQPDCSPAQIPALTFIPRTQNNTFLEVIFSQCLLGNRLVRKEWV